MPLLRNIAETAATLSISPDGVRRLIASGSLPHIRIGRRLLVADADLVRFVAANRSDPDAGKPAGKATPNRKDAK